jgi:uncharacterized protein
MAVFLDTSTLFKLYHKEDGSDMIDELFNNNKIKAIVLSELSKIEFVSTVWKKVRTKAFDAVIAHQIQNLF